MTRVAACYLPFVRQRTRNFKYYQAQHLARFVRDVLTVMTDKVQLTDRVQQLVSFLDGYRCSEQGCSILVMGVHQAVDANWIQLHTVGAVETDVLLRLSRDATPADALNSLRGALRDKGLKLTA